MFTVHSPYSERPEPAVEWLFEAETGANEGPMSHHREARGLYEVSVGPDSPNVREWHYPCQRAYAGEPARG